jgi:Stage II sporulation protein E (SpoIIE)
VAPSHTLRHQTRVLAARATTAIAVFITIAVVLLAGGSSGPLTNAEANNGDPPSLGGTPPGEEPVLEGGDETQPPDEPATQEPATEDPATEEPATEEPATEEPPTDEPAPGATPEEPAPGEDPGVEEPVDPGTGEGEEPNSGGDKGDESTSDPDIPPDDGEVEDPTPPSGGNKGEDPADESGVEEPAPDPNSRPQVTLSDDTGTEPGPSNPPEGEPGTPDVVPGTGDGNIDDANSIGGPGGDDHAARFGVAAGNGDGDGGAEANGGTGAGGLPAGTQLAAVQPGEDQPGDNGGNAGGGEESNGGAGAGDENNNVVTNTVERLVEVVPDELKAALAALAALSVMLGIGYLLAALRARRLSRQRRELLQEVGLLQTALLPPVPDRVGALLTSVAYRPADGPGAGGDFYDVLPLTGGRVGFILGDVSGHGRGALARTAFMRYTLRAYLEAGLEPRVALQVAGRVIDDNLGGDFATVLLAVHDPETGSLTYASAGHPAPIVVGPHGHHDPVTAASSPPIGVGVRTGLRQTTVPLVPGAVAALFTDGLLEARTEEGILGRDRLTELLAGIGDDATARKLIERVAAEANVRSDDMAAVVVTPTAGVTTGLFRTEQLELSTRELEGPIARRFLEACGLPDQEVDDAERDARLLAERFGGVVLHVVFGNRLRVEVLPRNVESIEAASRRVSAGNPQ